MKNKKLSKAQIQNEIIDEILKLEPSQIDFINKSLMRKKTCTKKPFFFDERVKDKDKHLSIVELNYDNSSVIRRIRVRNKEYYQFIDAYFCYDCNVHHQTRMIQIPSAVMKKHKIKL